MVGLLIILMMGCGRPDTRPSKPMSDSVDQNPAAHQDETPAPGTVRVRLAVESCDTESSPSQCTVTVREILAYGMSTSPLASGQTLSVALGSSEEQAAPLQPGRSRVVILRENGPRPSTAPDGPSSSVPKWRVIQVRQ